MRAAYLRHRHGGVRSPNTVMEEPAFLEALGPVAGLRVLDLGCGDGSTARLLLDAGAGSCVGVDGAAGMIGEARHSVDDERASFRHATIEDLDLELGGEVFDVVISRMALHYVAHLDQVLAVVSRSLPVGGQLVFSVVHPVITSHDVAGEGLRTDWTVDRYFDRGTRERSWFGSTVTWHHRTVEDYVGVVLRHGFRLETLSECDPDAELLAEMPDALARRRRVPLILLIGATKIG